MDRGQAGSLATMGIFFLVSLVMMVGMIAGWIICLVAMWRGMKAHESIAVNLKRILASRKGIPPQ